jgi:hypothetical protein
MQRDYQKVLDELLAIDSCVLLSIGEIIFIDRRAEHEPAKAVQMASTASIFATTTGTTPNMVSV